MKTKIAVLVSGGGTNLQALIDAQGTILKSGEIALVVSNHAGAYALERAKRAGIATAVVLKKECGCQAAFEEKLHRLLKAYGIEVIILAGFMTILSQNFTAAYPKRILNIHPSLIPSFCGEGMYGLRVHQAVLEKGVKVTGATVHFVNEIPDGGEIIAQKAVEVLPGDTPEILQRRVMEQAEWILLPQAAEQVCAGLRGGQQPTLPASRIKLCVEGESAMNVYQTKTMASLLTGNTYPGRGIVLGLTPDGKKSVAAYFIMGRSVNSRNRIFVEEPDGIRTEAYDASKMEDPSLIIYHPVRQTGQGLIVTNGDQTDTIREFLARGESWEAALRSRRFEHDGPNWTPRISGLLSPNGSYKLSILKSVDPEGTDCARFFYEYPAIAGLGHFLHTYVCDGAPVIPTFQGEPERVAIPQDIDAFTDAIWNSLNEDNKISLFVRYTDLETGAYAQRILNKHTK